MPTVVLTPDMQRVVRDQGLGFVATVGPDGAPNLSPKGTTTVWDDDHLVFADLRSPQTVRNLLADPRVELNVVDPVRRRGYRFRGTAEVHAVGPTYVEAVRRYGEERGLGPERIGAVVLVRVLEARAVTSPAYDGGATEEEVAAPWRRRHGGGQGGTSPAP